MEKRTCLTAIVRTVVVIGASLLVAVGPAGAQKQGGSIIVGTELDIPGFDPLKVGVFDTSAQMAAALIFDTLTGRDGEGAVVPKLALSWTHSDDYKTWTFRLRSNVTFHDGTPFNAEAVSWKYARHKDPKNKCGCAFGIQYIESVEATDDLTIVFHLRDPFVELPATLSIPFPNNIIYSQPPLRSSERITTGTR